MRVSIFKKVKASWPQETELDDIVRMMKTSARICVWTKAYRQNLAKGNEMAAEQYKTTYFPAFAPCVFFYDGKARENVIGMTDLCYLDIDHVKDESLIKNAMDILCKDPNVVLASRSVSNEGLHILIRYTLKGMDNPPQRTTMSPKEMQDIYVEVYDYFAAKYQMILGLESDYHARDMGRLYVVSYDPDLYYNPNAEALMIDLNNPDLHLEGEPTIWSLGYRISRAERLISKCCLDEAEQMLQDCHQWILDITGNENDAPKQDISSTLRKLEDYLAEIKKVIEKKAKVDELVRDIEEDLRNQDVKGAHAKIVECQQILKKAQGPFNNAIIKMRKKVHKKEKIMSGLNRELKRKAKEKRMQEEENN